MIKETSMEIVIPHLDKKVIMSVSFNYFKTLELLKAGI